MSKIIFLLLPVFLLQGSGIVLGNHVLTTLLSVTTMKYNSAVLLQPSML